MSQAPSSSNSDFLPFNNRNDGNNKNFKSFQGNQFHPYNKNRNQNNSRYEQYKGGLNDGMIR